MNRFLTLGLQAFSALYALVATAAAAVGFSHPH